MARCETFDNQQGKDVKAKQHWYPLKQDHPSERDEVIEEMLENSPGDHYREPTQMREIALD
jgi:hypothetical protein